MEKQTYAQAKKELETIVAELESGKTDMDSLTKKVKRAATLIAFCKEKLTETDKELQKIIDEID